MRQAEEGIRELKENVDTLIVIPNQRLISIAAKNTSLLETFARADDVLLQAVRGISDLIVTPGLINLDFADIRTVMSEMGLAMMGAASGSGENRAVEATQKAISSPLLEDVSIHGARGVLLNITGGPDLSLYEVNEAATMIQDEADENANIIFGAVIDEKMREELRITVIATGFDPNQKEARKPAQPNSAGKERKVVHLGTIVDDLDAPTWQRKKKEGNEVETVSLSKAAYPASTEEEDKFEIPAFLRRRMD
jgi:cell division protein FtsZ